MSTIRILSAVHLTGLVILVVALSVVSSSRQDQYSCTSSCGNLLNIKHPFRLRGDPEHCGLEEYELVCERRNRSVLYTRSTIVNQYRKMFKLYVEAINYDNYTIRVVDVGIQKENFSSLPIYPETTRIGFRRHNNVFIDGDPFSFVPWNTTENLVALVGCENPVLNSPFYKKATNTSYLSLSSLKTSHFYFLFGRFRMSDLEYGCSVLVSSWCLPLEQDESGHGFSYLDFHNKLSYGFELSWIMILCPHCGTDEFTVCQWNIARNSAFCYVDCYGKRSIKCLWKNFVEDYLVMPAQKIYLPRVIGAILAGRTLCGMIITFAFIIYTFRRRHLSMSESIEGFLQSNNKLMPIRYSYSHIKNMTKGLRDKLGEGGFGSVYKGKLRNGDSVAIKILGKSKSNGQDFINEVATIGRIHHVNVVRLIGFCAEGSKRALVYDFMPNGSLEKYIFSQEGAVTLSCSQMFDISLGVARGIEYLHRGCAMQILHFDIKPHNILLDENFNPRVSDFGLAKLYPTDNTSMVTLTAARGTMGYMAPELFYKNIGRVSYKADVYSFGMLLLEMAGRRRNLNVFADQTSQIYFPSWVYDEYEEGREVEMRESTEEERKMTRKMIITALWCIQMRPSDRPSMDEVVVMLEGETGLLEMPPKPFLTPYEMPPEDV